MTKKEMKKLMEGGKLVMGGTCFMLPLKECNAVVVHDENKVSHDDVCKCPLYSYFTQSGHQDTKGQVFLFILETEEGNQKSKIGQIRHLRLVRSIKEKEAEERRSVMTKEEMKVLEDAISRVEGEAKLEDGKLILGGEYYALPLKVCSAIVGPHDEVKMNQHCLASNGKCKCPLHSYFTQVAKEAGDRDAQVNGQVSLLALKTGEGSIGGIKIQELVH